MRAPRCAALILLWWASVPALAQSPPAVPPPGDKEVLEDLSPETLQRVAARMRVKRAQAQPSPMPGPLAAQRAASVAPAAFEHQATEQHASGTIFGTVTDATGAVVVDASVTLQNQASGEQRVATSDDGGLFNFAGVAPGSFKITIASKGFATWVTEGIALHQGETCEVPHIVLQVAPVTEVVEATLSVEEVAEEQLKAEEKQRVLGVFPNFYVTYLRHAAPLSAKQKFRLAWKTSLDPLSFVYPGTVAGIQQMNNSYPDFGQGAQGYAKRYGAAYLDNFTGIMLGRAVFPSLFHQDPRYYYKGTGSFRSRALYAFSRVVVGRGDNGRWQPNYSLVLGSLASGGISNLYYPSADRNGAHLTLRNAAISIGSDAVANLIQEFLLRKVTRGAPAREKDR